MEDNILGMFHASDRLDPHPGIPGHRKWICMVCGWILDESLGDPDHGILPHTPLEDYPDSWRCPECRVGKSEFSPFLDG